VHPGHQYRYLQHEFSQLVKALMTRTIITFALSLLLGFVGGAGGTLWVLRHEERITRPVIRARSFELMDESGKAVSRWGIDQYHNPLLAFAATGAAPSGPSGNGLSLDDSDSHRVAIGLSGDARPFLTFRGDDRKPRVNLWVSEYGKPVFSLYDENTWRVILGVRRSDTPGPADNDWGLDFYPDRAGIGMGTTKQAGRSYVQGYFFVHHDRVAFP